MRKNIKCLKYHWVCVCVCVYVKLYYSFENQEQENPTDVLISLDPKNCPSFGPRSGAGSELIRQLIFRPNRTQRRWLSVAVATSADVT